MSDLVFSSTFIQQKFNISTSDLDDFFGGPAFLAWSRMGNLHGLATFSHLLILLLVLSSKRF